MTEDGGFFTPFVEAIVTRPAFPTSHTSGSNTTAIDHLRQGVEVTDDKHRYIGTLPKLGSGNDDHEISLITFGQSQEFLANTMFEELVRFDPVVYINDQDVLMFPLVQSNASVSDPERFGGFIEPLSMGSRDLLLSITEFEPYGIRAHLQDGNDDSFGSADRIMQSLEHTERRQVRDVYIDAASTVGSGSYISIPGEVIGDEKVIEPFDELQGPIRAIESGTLALISSPSIRAVVSAMTGSASDSFMPYGFKSQGAGYTYDFNQIGTDSLAFGGLKRS